MTSYILQSFDSINFELIRTEPFHSKAQKVHSPNIFKRRCISEVVRIGLINNNTKEPVSFCFKPFYELWTDLASFMRFDCWGECSTVWSYFNASKKKHNSCHATKLSFTVTENTKAARVKRTTSLSQQRLAYIVSRARGWSVRWVARQNRGTIVPRINNVTESYRPTRRGPRARQHGHRKWSQGLLKIIPGEGVKREHMPPVPCVH